MFFHLSPLHLKLAKNQHLETLGFVVYMVHADLGEVPIVTGQIFIRFFNSGILDKAQA